MRNVKAKVLTVIIEAIGTITKSRRQYLSNLLEKNAIKEPQSHIVHCTQTAGSADVKVQNI